MRIDKHELTFIRKALFKMNLGNFAEVLGTTTATLSRWENGKRKMPSTLSSQLDCLSRKHAGQDNGTALELAKRAFDSQFRQFAAELTNLGTTSVALANRSIIYDDFEFCLRPYTNEGDAPVAWVSEYGWSEGGGAGILSRLVREGVFESDIHEDIIDAFVEGTNPSPTIEALIDAIGAFEWKSMQTMSDAADLYLSSLLSLAERAHGEDDVEEEVEEEVED